ncbi:MAG TPA: biopolymer transporter ExbD [Tepidisphaeraceae bacterium]|nr:biopolymer transporter ExbD [Tepidisphaeraceae bacterium]
MRFPRNLKIIRGQFDVAAFVGVLFLLVIFLLVHSSFVFPPGVAISLPETENLAGSTNATVTIAVDQHGQIYFQNQLSTESILREKLAAEAAKARQPLTLVIQADRSITYETMINLGLIARRAGIKEALLAVRPSQVMSPVPLRK